MANSPVVRSPNGEIRVTALLTEKLCFQSQKYYGSSDIRRGY
ncbi:hypothetical protein [Nostoc sp.]